MRTFLRPGDVCEHKEERIRFERQLSDNLLLFYVERTLAPFQIEDGNGGLRTPDCEWAIQAFSTGDLRVVANRNRLPTSARRQAEAREYDPDTAASLDQGYRRRRFVLTELDKLGEIPLSDLAIRRALDKIWAENPEAVRDLGGKPACRTVRRWLALRGHPGERHTRQLISMSGRVARARRLPLTTIRLLQRAAADYWAVRGRSIEDGYARLFEIMNYINQRRARLRPPLPQLRIPSVETLRKEVRGLECFDTYSAKYGERLAKTRFKGNGRGLTAARALRLGCMDHTLLDTVAVIDVETMLPMGRPWLTVLIDVRTRCIVGFVLTYEPPSNYAAMECIKRANRPKLHLLDRFPKFPVLAHIFGKFDEIVVDNGWELSGITFQDAMADVGTTVRWAPIASPTYKAIVERFFRILNQILNHKLPGGVLKPELLREMGYDPTEAAVLTIAELESLIWSAISYYHIEEHSTLRRPPASLWEQDMNAHGIDVIGDDRQLDKMAGALKPDCRLTTSGVELDGLRFHDPVATTNLLEDLIASEPIRGKRRGSATIKVKVKYNPLNTAEVHVWNRRRNVYVTLPCTDEHYTQGLTFWQHRQIRDWTRRKGLEFSTEQDRLIARARLIAEFETAAPGLRIKQRRAVARLMTSARVLEATKSGSVTIAHAPPRHDGLAPIVEHDALAVHREDQGEAPTRPPRGGRKAVKTKPPRPMLSESATPAVAPALEQSADLTEPTDEIEPGSDWKDYEL